MKITKSQFGVLSDGTEVNLYTINNGNMTVSCTNYGCTLTSIVLKNKDGSSTDVLLGFSTLEGYLNSTLSFGAIVGRFANRIADAKFELDGKIYNLAKNDGKNCLHGGFLRYDKMIYDAEIVETKDASGVKFTRTSPDGEQGFPGNVKLEITYLLDTKNNLTCHYTAVTDKATPINITNHAYFNLSGIGQITDHTLKMNSDKILKVNSALIPTGKFIDVKGTAFDFTTEKKIGTDINKVKPGYDHCYVTKKYDPANKQCGLPLNDDELVEFCTVKDPKSNHEMSVFTNMEGCQFYSGNYVKGVIGKNGEKYKNHDALCLETQCFPDTPNNPDFPSCILQPGQKMNAKTIYSFKF